MRAPLAIGLVGGGAAVGDEARRRWGKTMHNFLTNNNIDNIPLESTSSSGQRAMRIKNAQLGRFFCISKKKVVPL